MITRVIGVVLASVATASMAQSVAQAQSIASPELRGEALLTRNCARCHAVGRTGRSPHPEAPAFRSLSRKYPVDGLAEALAEGLSVGHPDMPEFVFEVDQVSAILSYLRSIQER